MRLILRPPAVGLPLLALLCFALAGLAMPRPALASPPDEPTPIMGLDEVRVGMKGYGLTVFSGTRIEPFPIEVVSVINHSGPQRSIIWIRALDERIEKSGPVQGMSGSPIFLWDDGEEQAPGQGGRLIGAFAFGYSEVKEPLVGVQPIEYMRQTGDRVDRETPSARAAGSTAGLARDAMQMLQRLERIADARNVADIDRMQLTAAKALLEPLLTSQRDGEQARDRLPDLPRDHAGRGDVMPMLLPMAVESPDVASMLRPLLEPMGITTVGGGGMIAGPPPLGMDVEGVKLEPGSVLSVPLVFGDLDLSASGTVTDVLPDGTVLAFGHRMFGEGPINLPMASGFVHFIVPRLSLSFKVSGSLDVAGTLLQDEIAGIAGTPDQQFSVAPLTINVAMPGHGEQTYNYNVVDHPRLTPTLTALATLRSITAAQDLPVEHTIYLDGELRFTGGHVIHLDSMMAGQGAFGALFELLPPLATAMQNPHEALKLESVVVNTRVVPELRMGTIVNARLDQAEVAPGKQIGVTVWVRPYGQSVQQFRTQVRVPPALPEGDYQLIVSGADTYLGQMVATRPHLFMTSSVDDLMEMMQRILSVRRDRIHATLLLPEQGIAVGRHELPQLPSSRRAMIFTPTSTVAMPFMETVEGHVETDMAIQGELAFTVHVRNNGHRPTEE
ncbi:hypothetical protein ACERK3_06620 [Phycisphaerales bacterium AB-hyl4]|uniref:Peptidase S55 domain-containing protein n=1 Tax=Natronomicrosphaera hydrolytica TaxID=3242702 RepID=A0ABV4U490_9BACT